MAKKSKKNENLTLEEQLEQAFVSNGAEPYELPDNWCWAKLGCYIKYATDYVANGSFADLRTNVKIYKEPNYALMVKTADFANNFTKSLTYTDKTGYEYLSKSRLQGGELILSNIGSVGKVFRVPYFKTPMTLASNSIMIKCHDDLDYDLLYYYFSSLDGYQNLLSITSGTAVPKFNKTDLKNIFVPIPPKGEQERIVKSIEKLFNKLDEAKDKVQETIDGFEDRKLAILHKAFTGELTAHWRKENSITKDTWKRCNLQSVCSMKITDGTHKTPIYSDEVNGVPFLSSKDVTSEKINWENIKYIDANLHEELYARLAPQKDDVLLAKNGTTGIAAIVDVEKVFDLYVTLALLRPDKSIVNPQYLLKIINSPICKIQFNERLKGIGVPNLHLRDIREVMIDVPSIPEQDEIVRILNDVMYKENSVMKKSLSVIEQIDAIKKAILSRAFRGKLGTNDPTEESAIELIKKHIEETIKEVPSRVKKLKLEKIEVSVVVKTIIEALQNVDKLTPERLKAETQLDIDDFYEQLKLLIDSGKIKETRVDGESYLEAVK